MVVNCTVTTNFPISEKPRKKKLEDWLAELPADATLNWEGISDGRLLISASWKEIR